MDAVFFKKYGMVFPGTKRICHSQKWINGIWKANLTGNKWLPATEFFSVCSKGNDIPANKDGRISILYREDYNNIKHKPAPDARNKRFLQQIRSAC